MHMYLLYCNRGLVSTNPIKWAGPLTLHRYVNYLHPNETFTMMMGKCCRWVHGCYFTLEVAGGKDEINVHMGGRCRIIQMQQGFSSSSSNEQLVINSTSRLCCLSAVWVCAFIEFHSKLKEFTKLRQLLWQRWDVPLKKALKVLANIHINFRTGLCVCLSPFALIFLYSK